MTDTQRKKAFIVSDFTDAGTGESFTAGSTPLIEVGAFDNYEASGLVRAPTAEKPNRTAAPKQPAKTKPAAKAPVKAPVKADADVTVIPVDVAKPVE